jgi:hypothetical protein
MNTKTYRRDAENVELMETRTGKRESRIVQDHPVNPAHPVSSLSALCVSAVNFITPILHHSNV